MHFLTTWRAIAILNTLEVSHTSLFPAQQHSFGATLTVVALGCVLPLSACPGRSLLSNIVFQKTVHVWVC
jgi:hypothetical protein